MSYRYLCRACDVYGYGCVCWLCETRDVKFNEWPKTVVSEHHHDPESVIPPSLLRTDETVNSLAAA